MVKRMDNYFKGFIVEYIERNKFFEADELVKATARNTPMPADIFFQVLKDASVKIVPPEPRDWRAKWLTFTIIMSQIVRMHKP
jgi:hypothetical protein